MGNYKYIHVYMNNCSNTCVSVKIVVVSFIFCWYIFVLIIGRLYSVRLYSSDQKCISNHVVYAHLCAHGFQITCIHKLKVYTAFCPQVQQ